MKVLRIKGCNLASLAGTFELDLTSGPLGRTGLFAITGPTGAGKSTLLDALCLALFDKTPRLEQAGKAWIGHGGRDDPHTLTAKDVRSVLRHDAGSGYAEADFVGGDGLRYRARWEVQRANKRPSGKLQAQKMALECLDTGEQAGGTKRQILAEISARLGLSFHQFQRSALLAQGEFAALLVAERGERAELLERMTGTDIYARVSVVAAEQYKETRARVDQLTEEIARVPGQSTPREPLAEQAASWANQVAAAQADLTRATGSNRWAEALAALRQDLADAERTRQETAQAIAAARDWRRTLAEAQALSGLRSQHRAVHAHRDRAAEAHAAAASAEQDLQHAVAQEQTLAQVLGRAQDQAARAQAELTRCGPIWDEALAADTKIVAAAAELSRAATHREQAQAKHARARDALQRLDEQTQALAAHAQTLTDWLAANDRALRVQPVWVSTERKLRRLAHLQRDRTGAGLDALQAQAAAARAVETTCSARLAELQGQLRAARDAVKSVRLDPERELAAERTQAALHGDLTRLSKARSVHERALRAGREHAEAARLGQASAMAAAEESQLATATQAELAIQQPLLDQARATLARLRAAMDLSAHRAQLEPGVPCPLCGALEHPHAQRGPLDPLIQDQEQRVRDQADAVAALSQQLARAQERERAATAAVQAAAQTQQSARARLDSLAEQWPADLGPDPQVADPLDALDDALAERQRQAERERAALQSLRAARDAAHAHAAALEGDTEAAQTELEAASAAARSAHDLWTRSKNHADALQEQTQGLRQELADLLATDLADPDAIRTALEADQAALTQTQADQRANQDAWTQAQLALAGARVVAEQARSTLDQATHDLHDAQGVHRTLVDRRRQLLDGPVDAARARVQSVAAQASTALQERATQHAAAQARLTQATTALERARAGATAADQAAHAAQTALDAALAQVGVTQTDLERLAPVTDTWLDQHRALAQDQDEALVRATAIVQERTARLAAHRDARPEGEPADAARLEALRAALDAAQSGLAQAQLALLEHDQNAGRAAALMDELANAERALAPLRVVRDLIGSAKGDKFRQFAQGLTLETLLAHANQHLAQLAPRYALMRVPSEDLEIQVIDRDLGDDVRSVNSLSGGESFMASLALALGLSSMSARDTRVETLFIDEGFGSLDRKTLDTALATLDALQATGRTVGIISHVQGIGDHVGVQVRVVKEAPGRARVLVPQD